MKPYEYKFVKEECWYREVCGKYDTAECYASCLRYLEMHYLMNTANLPKKKQYPIQLTVTNTKDRLSFAQLFDIKNNISKLVDEGMFLYIYSPHVGNGKTSWALKLLHAYFNQIWLGNGFETRGIFINVPTFLIENKNNISNPDENFMQLRTLIQTVDLVVFDDIGVNDLSNYDYNIMISTVDKRYFEETSCIFTGNIPPDKLSSAVGSRLSSRILSGKAIQLFGNDWRTS